MDSPSSLFGFLSGKDYKNNSVLALKKPTSEF